MGEVATNNKECHKKYEGSKASKYYFMENLWRQTFIS